MSKDDDKFIVRLPPGLRWKIKERAAKNRRSMNSETLLAIESWLEMKEPLPNLMAPQPKSAAPLLG